MAIYWTLQRLEAWIQFEKQGYLEGSPEHAVYDKEYDWMKTQMKLRLPNYNGEQPIWLWPKKPDMRSTGHFHGNTRCVRITVELDEKDVLMSDFEEWHIVLNNGFNANNEQEFDDFYNNKLAITKEDSWVRIFDIYKERDPEWDGASEVWLQGVTGRIPLSRVKKVEHFVTRTSALEKCMNE